MIILNNMDVRNYKKNKSSTLIIPKSWHFFCVFHGREFVNTFWRSMNKME